MYAALTADQLKGAEATKASLEARAVTLISTAGGLVTVIGAVAALVGVSAAPKPSLAAIGFVGVSVSLFAAAIYFALRILRPTSHTVARAAGLLGIIRHDWDDSEDVAVQRVAHLNAIALRRIRDNNSCKAANLHAVARCVLLAVLALVGAVVISLIDQETDVSLQDGAIIASLLVAGASLVLGSLNYRREGIRLARERVNDAPKLRGTRLSVNGQDGMGQPVFLTSASNWGPRPATQVRLEISHGVDPPRVSTACSLPPDGGTNRLDVAVPMAWTQSAGTALLADVRARLVDSDSGVEAHVDV